MQYISAIFINTDDTPFGNSAANFVYAQTKLSEKNNLLPFYGVSACESPDGGSYIGWGHMDKNVVTPHASVLAIKWMPNETIANLKALEENDMRPDFVDGKTGKKYKFGFTDSYNVVSKEASSRYLILDQGMLFLSLANFLHGDIVRKKFADNSLGSAMNKKMRDLNAQYNIQDFDRLAAGGPYSVSDLSERTGC